MKEYSQNEPCFYQLEEPRGVYEIQVQTVWSNISKHKTYWTTDRRELKVLSTGTWNVEAGPDFKGAKLVLAGEVVTGDVEIHYDASDWYYHGHDHDPAFEQVVLHVVTRIDESETPDPDIPTLVLQPRKQVQSLAPAQKVKNGLCVRHFSALNNERVHELLVSAGIKRLQMKADLFVAEMMKYGSEYVVLLKLFEALGYKENRQHFIELFRRTRQYSSEELCNYGDAILWGESGMLPDPAVADVSPELKSHVGRCWQAWWLVRGEPMTPIDWKHASVRPLNSPERRLAALVVLMKRLQWKPMTKLLKHAVDNPDEPHKFYDVIRSMLTVHDPLWDRYTNFFDVRKKPAAVLGGQRVLDIIVNVVVPAIAAYGILEKRYELTALAHELLLALPRSQSNRLQKNAEHRWFMPPSRGNDVITNAVAAQGVIFLYQNFCEKNHVHCSECALFQSE